MSNVSLDTLPVEILHHIFGHLDVRTIICSVRRVCKQLYAVVNSYDHFKVEFTQYNKFYYFRQGSGRNMTVTRNSDLQFLIRFIHPSKVTSMTLTGSEISENGVDFFLNNFNITEFLNLRSLSILQADTNQLNQILQYLTIQLLVSLTITLRDLSSVNKIFTIIFSVIVRTNLQKLCLNNLDYTNIEISWPNQNTLQQLIIRNCTCGGYRIILGNLHNLRTLVIGDCIMTNNDNETKSSHTVVASNPPKRQRTSIESIVYSQLISLAINNCSMSMQDLEFILTLTPALVHFKLISNRSTLDQMFAGSSWEQFIQNHLRSLSKFQFLFTCCKVEFDDDTTFDSFILPFQNQFWLSNKQWPVGCDYIPQVSTFRLYTLPDCKSFQRTLPMFQVTSTDSECRFMLISHTRFIFDTKQSVPSPDVSVSLCKIRDNLTQYVVVALLSYKSLINLDLSCNKIGDIGAQYLAHAFRNHETLALINLTYNQIGNNGAECLFNVLKENKSLIQLILCYNPGSSCEIISTAFNIQKNNESYKLNLKSRNIGDDEIKFLSEPLIKNKTLVELSLSDNRIGDIGAQQLADALQNHPTLIVLDLSYNTISNNGIQYLNNAFKANKTLQKLNLEKNSGSYSTVVSAAIMIRNCGEINNLLLNNSNIGDNEIKFVCEALYTTNTVTSLDLSGNQIGDIGVQYLADALKSNNIALTIVKLTNNKIGRIGAECLAEVLEKNQILLELDIEANHIGNIGAEKLTSALRSNKTLKTLSLGNNKITREIRDSLVSQEKRLCFSKLSQYDSDESLYYYESD